MEEFKVKRLFDDATLPTKANPGDAGYDLVAHRVVKDTGDVVVFGTGVAVSAPANWYFHVYPRSSVSNTGYMLANSVGIIDPGYQGELLVAMRKVSDTAPLYEVGDRIAQLIPVRAEPIGMTLVDDLGWGQQPTARAGGGFGSSGR